MNTDLNLTEQQSGLAWAIRDFVTTMAGGVEGYWTLSVMEPGGPPKTAFIGTQDSDRLTYVTKYAAIRNTQGFGVHLGMAGRREELEGGRRGGDDDVTNLSALWCDIDDGNWQAIAYALDRFRMPPSLVCFTGRGYHIYWRLAEPMPANAVTQRILTQMAHLGGELDALVAQGHLGEKAVDESAGRISTMMRVPWTIKYRVDTSFETKVILRHPYVSYHPSDFAWLDPGPEPKRLPRPFVKKEETERIALTAADIAARCDGIQKGREWYCRCPNPRHGKGLGDRGRSMEVRDGEKGVVITCFSPTCTTEDIVASLGLTMRDLMRDDSRPATRAEMRAMGLNLFGVETE